MTLTANQLIERLQAANNRDAVAVVCVEGIEYTHVSDLIDESQAPDKDGVIGNVLLVSAELNEIVSRTSPNTRPQPQLVVAVTSNGYWGKGADLEEAMEKARKAGNSGTSSVVIYIYTGPKEELEKINVDGLGGISYPQTCTSNRVGKVKMPAKQS